MSYDFLGKTTGETRRDITVTAGTTSSPLHIKPGDRPSVTANPVSGGTALVEFSNSTISDIDGATAVWEEWDIGTVSALTTRKVTGEIRALRLTATTQNCVLTVLRS